MARENVARRCDRCRVAPGTLHLKRRVGFGESVSVAWVCPACKDAAVEELEDAAP